MSPALVGSHDPPLYLERQNAVYVGRITEEGRGSATFAYYLHGRDDLFLGTFSEDGFEPQYALDTDASTMGEAVAAFETLEDLSTELSITGRALSDAHVLAETGILGVKQAHVYVLRDVYEFNQQDTAKILDIGFSTVSTHLADARRNVENALTFLDQYDELQERKEILV